MEKLRNTYVHSVTNNYIFKKINMSTYNLKLDTVILETRLYKISDYTFYRL